MKKTVNLFFCCLCIVGIVVILASCKNTTANKAEGDDSDITIHSNSATTKKLIGVWKCTSMLNEAEGTKIFPFRPDETHEVYMFAAYTPEGKVRICSQTIDLSAETIFLYKQMEYNFVVKGNEMTWKDEKGEDTVNFLLRDNEFFSTITKDDYGNIIVWNYKRTKSPTLEEMMSAEDAP